MENFKQFIEQDSLDEGYTKSAGYKSVEEMIGYLVKALNPNSQLCKGISKKADDVTDEFKKMQKHIEEIDSLWGEIDYIVGMSNER